MGPWPLQEQSTERLRNAIDRPARNGNAKRDEGI